MTFRKFPRALACILVVAAFSGGALFAEEPAKGAAPPAKGAPKSDQGLTTLQFLLDSTASNLSLATATYGNALGVEIADIDAALRTQLGLDEGTGVVVTGVNKESEAAKAGLARHDLVLKAGDEAVGSSKQFHDLVANQKGKSVAFHILRKGKPATVSVKVPETPVYSLAEGNLSATFAGGLLQLVDVAGEIHTQAEQHYRIGVQLAEADDTLRSQLRLAAGEGLVVTDVVADSPAAKAGIQKNDVLTKLDGKRLKTVEAVSTQIQDIKDRKVPVALFRGGNEVSCDLTPKLSSESGITFTLVGELDGLIRVREAERAVKFVVELQPDGEVKVASRPTAAEQLAILKNQLAEMQKSLAALEAALKAAPEEKK